MTCELVGWGTVYPGCNVIMFFAGLGLLPVIGLFYIIYENIRDYFVKKQIQKNKSLIKRQR